MITTSGPWLKMAPKWLGQWRRQASQLMHSAISMRSGGFFHLGCAPCGDPLETGAGRAEPRARGAGIDPRVKDWWTDRPRRW